MMIDAGQWLCVDGIDASCTIGGTERERQCKQRLVNNLRLDVDFSAVGIFDEVGDTVDYRLVSRRVVAEAEKSSFKLIETLAAHLGHTALAEFPKIRTQDLDASRRPRPPAP